MTTNRGTIAELLSEAVARAARERSEQEREARHCEARRKTAIRDRSKQARRLVAATICGRTPADAPQPPGPGALRP